MLRSSFCVLAGFSVAILLVGCDSSTPGVSVKVSVASQKVKLEDTDNIEVVFTPEGKGEPAGAAGSFKTQPLTATRGTAPGVVPGKYKLTVKVTPYAGMAPQRDQVMAEFNKRFDATNSKLNYEVTADKEQAVSIDLDANTVTKK